MLTRHHATAFLAADASRTIEDLRRTWDPRMARQIAAHLTLIYPEEIPYPGELAAQAAAAAARTPPSPSLPDRPFIGAPRRTACSCG